jgi:hypothetical protein
MTDRVKVPHVPILTGFDAINMCEVVVGLDESLPTRWRSIGRGPNSYQAGSVTLKDGRRVDVAWVVDDGEELSVKVRGRLEGLGSGVRRLEWNAWPWANRGFATLSQAQEWFEAKRLAVLDEHTSHGDAQSESLSLASRKKELMR